MDIKIYPIPRDRASFVSGLAHTLSLLYPRFFKNFLDLYDVAGGRGVVHGLNPDGVNGPRTGCRAFRLYSNASYIS